MVFLISGSANCLPLQDFKLSCLYTVDRSKVFDETHSGAYGAHLQEAKVHGQLSKHYWWPQICTDITTFVENVK